MEVLSVAASGMAVVSLSLQLLNTIGTVKTFIRDVKGASKELERMADLLDRLHALLENVRDVIKRQTSLQSQHFPAPSPMIFDALKSCENSLEPLVATVEKHKKSQVGSVSAVVKWKDDIKFAFETKDIAEFEVRIQRDIDYLHAALTVNSTSILTMALPTMLQNQQKCMTSPLADRKAVSIQYQSVEKQLPPPRILTKPLKRRSQQSWWPAQIGVYHRRSATYFQNEENKTRKLHHDQNVVSYSHDVILVWKFLKFGIHWTKQPQHSYIPSSVNVFPIVDCASGFTALLLRAPIVEIQKTFASGKLHPFTRTSRGYSLLHLAARFYRADVIRLLMQYGLEPDLTSHGDSPLLEALLTTQLPSKDNGIETMRLLFHEGEMVDDFEDPTSRVRASSLSSIIPINLEILEWLWNNAGGSLSSDALLGLRFRLLENLIWRFQNLDEINHITEFMIRLVPTSLIQRYHEDGNELVRGLLYSFGSQTSIDSSQIGGAFINLLERLGLNVESYVDMKGECFLDGPFPLPRKVLFERSESGDWILKWIWVHDTSAPGHLIASEHISLGADAWSQQDWPFSKPWYHEDSDEEQRLIGLRFDRRMMDRSRKERARMGQKRVKSRMPGSWSW